MSDQARIYYNVEVSNNTGSDMEAKYDSGGLLAPLINNPQDYEVSVVRFRIPTSTIPIFPDNLPYNELQVGLDYLTTQIIEPVQQYGATTIPEYVYGFDPSNAGTHYIGRFTVNSNASLSNETLISIPGSYSFYEDECNGICLNNDTLFLSYQNLSSPYHYLVAVKNFDFNNYVIVDRVSHPLNNPNGRFYGCSVDTNNNLLITTILGGDTAAAIPGYVRFYDLTTYQALYSYPITNALKFVRVNQTLYVTLFASAACNLYNYTRIGNSITVLPLGALEHLPTSISIYSYITTNGNNVFIARPLGTTVFSVYQFSVAGGIASPATTVTFTTATSSTLFGIFCNDTTIYAQMNEKIYNKNINTGTSGSVYDIVNSAYYGVVSPSSSTTSTQPIYKIAEFVSVINSAYSRAYDRLKIIVPTIPTEGPPFLTFDPVSKLFSIYAPEEYSTQNLNVYMNQKLYKYFSFMALPSNGLYNITIENYLVNNLILGSSHFIQMTQERTSLSKINQLTKIVITSSHLPIVGDVQDNSTVSYITDFTPDTTVPGELLILYPTLLRLYSLYSNREIRQVDLQIYYSTNSQDFQKLYIESGESFSVKLEFRNKNASSSY